MTDIGKEYGTALFMLACEAGGKKQYAQALKTVKEIFSTYPEYPAFLASPSVSLSERINAIQQAFANALPEHVVSFLMLLCEKGRMDGFDAAVEEYCALLDASEHISKAKIICAAELTVKEKEKLKKKLESICKGEVHTEYVIEPTLLGGVIVEVDGKVMDGSLRHRLQDVKDVMNK